jgi:hypothetical protein
MLNTTNFNNKLHKQILKLCHCAKLRPHNFVRGSKLFDNYQRVALIVLFIQSGKSLRDFTGNLNGSLNSWKHWLQLKKLPSKSTLHLWLKTFNLKFIRELLHQAISGIKSEIVAVDGSGIDTYHKSSYYQKRLKDFGFRKLNNPWHKLDIIVDVKSKEKWILDFSFLIKQKHDSKVAWRLFNRFKLKNLIVLADKGYYWLDLFDFLRRKNNSLVVPPKEYGKSRRTKKRLTRLNFHQTYENNKELYALRNNVESVFSSLKRVQGLKIRSRKSFMKKREMGWNILWYNLRKKLSLHIIFILKIIQFPKEIWNSLSFEIFLETKN